MDGCAALTRWADCGGMWLTGPADGPALAAPAAVATVFDEWARELDSWVEVDGAGLIGERAAIADLSRRGVESCGGGTRLLETLDGWVALTLSRDCDVDALEALFGEPVDGLDWPGVEALARQRRALELRDQAVLLGMPIGVLGERRDEGPLVERLATGGRSAVVWREALRELLVVDLSAMWAGPLCGQLLTLAGAQVVKVESTGRPDGARRGPAAFFDLLHAGQRSVAVDFRSSGDRAQLATLLRRADVVIESSRPRALTDLGVGFEQQRITGWDGVWVSITGHGIDDANAMRVGFGDDAAVAGGLVAWHSGRPVFCADAIADPATGLLAAGAVFDALASGWTGRLSVSLARTAAYLAGRVAASGDGAGDPACDPIPQPPRCRPVTGVGPVLGAHNDEVFGR